MRVGTSVLDQLLFTVSKLATTSFQLFAGWVDTGDEVIVSLDLRPFVLLLSI